MIFNQLQINRLLYSGIMMVAKKYSLAKIRGIDNL
jgi:hypothetical protein